MKLKLDENGNVVLDNGFPVWVADDGKEIAYNVPDLVNKLSIVNSESAGRRKEIDELTAKLKTFDGVDLEKHKTLLEMQSDIEAGKLVKAGDLDGVKRQIVQSFETKISDLEKARTADLEKNAQAIQSKDAAIRNLLVKGAFDASTFLREKTVLPPDLAYQSFGKHFEVKEENGELKVIASLDGQPIFSRANPGTPATPEESIESIIEAYPMKDRILKSTPGGAGTNNNGGQQTTGGKTMTRAVFDGLDPASKVKTMKEGVTLTD